MFQELIICLFDNHFISYDANALFFVFSVTMQIFDFKNSTIKLFLVMIFKHVFVFNMILK